MKLSCIGCGINCNHLSENNKYKLQCGFKKLVIWPDTNHYFRLAIHNIFFENNSYCFNDGIIVVDFSCINIMHYMNKCWVNELAQTGLKIVIIAEASMFPLANYWLTHSESIWAIIELDDDINTIILKFRTLMKGRQSPGRRYPALSQREIITLKLMLEGYSTKEIAKKMSCSPRNIYDSRYSLRKKIGGINHFRKLFTITNT
jgi:Response regulator containing a CheY-like receiver domain and an HTH DNA-binding domain